MPEISIKLKYAMNSFRYDEGNVYERRKSGLALQTLNEQNILG